MTHDYEAACLCVSDHRPPVLEYERHHILPRYLGGEDTDDNLLWLCSTTHSNVHELLRMMMKAGAALTDHHLQQTQDRPVSRYAATLARTGYTQAAQRMATFHVYQDEAGEFRWVAPTGRTISVSGEGYESEFSAHIAAERANPADVRLLALPRD